MYARFLLLSSYAHSSTAVEKKYPGDRDRLGRLSLIEGSIYLVTCQVITLINIYAVIQRATQSRSEWPTLQSSGAEKSMVLPNSIQT
jgi:hypothetical protein